MTSQACFTSITSYHLPSLFLIIHTFYFFLSLYFVFTNYYIFPSAFISYFNTPIEMINYIFITHFPLHWFERFTFDFYAFSGYISIIGGLHQNLRITLTFKSMTHPPFLLVFFFYLILKFLHQTGKLLDSKENNQQSEKAT